MTTLPETGLYYFADFGNARPFTWKLAYRQTTGGAQHLGIDRVLRNRSNIEA